METVLQKATELGVGKIIPVVSERTEVKDLNYDRAKKIVIEATEQSNQLAPSEISEIIKLKDFLDSINESTKLLFADVNSSVNLKADDFKKSNSLCILIGPEGDFSPSEREKILKRTNTIPFSLSKNILRTETAAISAITLVSYLLNL